MKVWRYHTKALPFEPVMDHGTEEILWKWEQGFGIVVNDHLLSPRFERITHDIRERFGNDRSAVERFTKEIAPLILTGPPGVTGFAGGRPKVEEIVAYWPALIPKSEIEARVEILNV